MNLGRHDVIIGRKEGTEQPFSEIFRDFSDLDGIGVAVGTREVMMEVASGKNHTITQKGRWACLYRMTNT
jgi:hypothetical protein